MYVPFGALGSIARLHVAGSRPWTVLLVAVPAIGHLCLRRRRALPGSLVDPATPSVAPMARRFTGSLIYLPLRDPHDLWLPFLTSRRSFLVLLRLLVGPPRQRYMLLSLSVCSCICPCQDLLWKLRVEEEDRRLPMEDDYDMPEINREAGLADRTWTPDEKAMLTQAVLKHGAHFQSIINDKEYREIHAHSTDAMQHQWRIMEGSRMRNKDRQRSKFLRLAKLRGQRPPPPPAANPFFGTRKHMFDVSGTSAPGSASSSSAALVMKRSPNPGGTAGMMLRNSSMPMSRVSTAPAGATRSQMRRRRRQERRQPANSKSGTLPSLPSPLGAQQQQRQRQQQQLAGPGALAVVGGIGAGLGDGGDGRGGGRRGGVAPQDLSRRRALLKRLRGLESHVKQESQLRDDLLSTVRSIKETQDDQAKSMRRQLEISEQKNREYRDLLRRLSRQQVSDRNP